MEKIIREIAVRQSWKIHNIVAVHGGDINQAFCVETNGGKFFIKLNSAEKYPAMFEKEANGLKALQKHFHLKVPDIIAFGTEKLHQYLVLEWLQPATAKYKTWEAFGQALATMHKATNEHFGWHEETYIASIRQTNEWTKSWPEFYTEQRILPLVRRLRNEYVFDENDVLKAEAFCKRFYNIIPDETPALLHGDLWSGNVMATSVNGETTTAIFDPDVFYGHREIDIAMTKLFGGFPTTFYDAYNEIYPLEKTWQQRLPLFQLYPVLVHAMLFGGGYIDRAKKIMNNE